MLNTWEVIQSLIQRFWDITEEPIEVYAQDQNIPMELYTFAELGLDYWSRDVFRQRDVYSRWPDLEKMFFRLADDGWLIPIQDGHYRVSDRARAAVRGMVKAGDQILGMRKTMPINYLGELVGQLRAVVDMCIAAPFPPGKWAIMNRYRSVDSQTPPLGNIREQCMDLFAYRDDCHLHSWQSSYPVPGYVWNTLSMLWTGKASTPEVMAQRLAFRGYLTADYHRALDHLITLGWARFDGETYAITEQGRTVRAKVENLTDEYFYSPWGVLTGETRQAMHNNLASLLAGLQE
jgi:hypothetical protein